MGAEKICKCGKRIISKRSDAKQCKECRRKQQRESSIKINQDRTFKKFANKIKNPYVYTDGVFNPNKAKKAIQEKEALEEMENEFRDDYFDK